MGVRSGTGKGGHKPKGTKKLVLPQALDLRRVLARNLRTALDTWSPPPPNQPENSRGIAELARAAGCSASTIQRILNASVSPRVDQVADIAAALGTSPVQLFDRNVRPQGRGVTDTEAGPGRELQRPRG